LTACLKKIASVNLDTKVGDDHSLRFTLVAWSSYWSRWTPNDGLEYSKILPLFLSIDLKTCIVHAFSLDSNNFKLIHVLHPNPFNPSPTEESASPHSADHALPETIITQDKPQSPDHVELIAQCVSHLRSSFEAALVLLSDLTLAYSPNQAQSLSQALVHYLTHRRCKNEEDPRFDSVVQTLKHSRTSQPDRFAQLMQFDLKQMPGLSDYFSDD
jgi:hypothetical protein